MSRRLLIIAVAILAATCRGRIISPSNQTPVVLISIDTLRSDHLPAYGYKGVATPHIDALRADSVLYQRAYSHVPLTLPSHVTILTGMLPAGHGVHDNVGFRLKDSTATIQELLKKNGYATGGAISAFVLRKETGIARGFDFYDDEVEPLGSEKTISRVQRDGRRTARALESWLDARTDKPFFAFLHLYEPHTPYTPPEPYFSRYPNHYDGEIAYADEIVGEFLADLKQRNVYDKSLIILLSDHGEGLGEHGEDEHGIFLYREALQVPLIVKLPHKAKAGATVATPVQLLDVFPTILERTGTPAPTSGSRSGQSLLAFLDGGRQRQIYSESYYPRFAFGWSDLHSLIVGDEHFIRAPQPELYDLAGDPAEKRNIVQLNRRASTRLAAAIEPLIGDAAAPANISREESAKLAALGYIGSTAATRPGQPLPDPKTNIGILSRIRTAFALHREGRQSDALHVTNQLLTTNPQITDLWDLKVSILNKMGRHRDALETAKEGLRHIPGAIQLLFDAANDSLAVGDLDTAEQHAEIAATIEPAEGHEILARVWAYRGDEKRTEAEAKLALNSGGDRVIALMLLANIEKRRGHAEPALAYLDRAAAASQNAATPPKNLHLERGDILARLGRNADAEKEFRAEIANFPSSPDAYSSLAMLLAIERRLAEETTVIYDLIKAAPVPHSYAVVAETLKAIGDDRGAMYWLQQGLQKYPSDAELRALPRRFAAAAAPRRPVVRN